MIFRYKIKKGKHYHSRIIINFLRSLFRPIFSKKPRIVTLMLDCAYFDNLTPSQDPPQINKLFGYAYLMIPHWNSVRLGISSHNGYVELYQYYYKNGVRGKDFIKRVHQEEIQDSYITDISGRKFVVLSLSMSLFDDIDSSFLRILPVFRIHSYFGGKLPAPCDLYSVVVDDKLV